MFIQSRKVNFESHNMRRLRQACRPLSACSWIGRTFGSFKVISLVSAEIQNRVS